MDTLSDLPPVSRAAFLLDLDGTLLDIAPTPDEVVVHPDLCRNLRRLRVCCQDALAIVTGRPIRQVDALLGDVPFAVAGEHGTAIRRAPGSTIEHHTLPMLPAAWHEAATRLVASHPGSMLEPKTHGLVLHYRAAPESGDALHHGLRRLLGAHDTTHVILAAKMAWEVRPAGVDKGTAVRDLMRHPPFAGRLPVFVGDDVTDEDGMQAARALGGIGLRVPTVFGEPSGVRAWIERLGMGELPCSSEPSIN